MNCVECVAKKIVDLEDCEKCAKELENDIKRKKVAENGSGKIY